MDIKQLRYFVSIARHGSFSRASAHLRIAQPALSSQIAALEAYLKTALFVRHSRGVALTQAGEALLPRAQDILDRVELAARHVRALGPSASVELRLGLPTTMTGVVARPLIDAFASDHPHVVLHIVEGMTGHLLKWLDQDDLDGAILYDRAGSARSDAPPMGREQLVVIGRGRPDFANREALSLADIAPLPLVHTTRAHQVRRMIDRYCAQRGVALNVQAEIDSLPQIREFLLSGSGYTILPESISLAWRRDGLRAWPVEDPRIHVAHHLVSSPRFGRHERSGPLLDVVGHVVRGLIAQGRWPGASLGGGEESFALTLADPQGR